MLTVDTERCAALAAKNPEIKKAFVEASWITPAVLIPARKNTTA